MPNDRGREYGQVPRGQDEPAPLRQLLAPFLTAADLPAPSCKKRNSATQGPRPSGEAGGVVPAGLLLELHRTGALHLVPLLALLRLRTRAGPVRASAAKLARELGQDEGTVRRNLASLEAAGLVRVTRTRGQAPELETLEWQLGAKLSTSDSTAGDGPGPAQPHGQGQPEDLPGVIHKLPTIDPTPGVDARGTPGTDARGSVTSRPRARTVWGIGVNHSGVDAPGARPPPPTLEAVRAAAALLLDGAAMWPNTREEVQDRLSQLLERQGPEAMRAWVDQLLAALQRHEESRRGRLALGALRKRTAPFRAASERAKQDTGGTGRGG